MVITEKIWLAKEHLNGDGPASLGLLRGDLSPVLFCYEKDTGHARCVNLMFTGRFNPWSIQTVAKENVIPIKDNIDIHMSSRGRKGSWDESVKLLETNDIVVVNFPQFNIFKTAISELENITKQYKHRTILTRRTNGYKKRSELLLSVALYRLRVVNPIYNLNKMDGFGLSILMFDKSRTKQQQLPVVMYSEDILVANHTDNILRIDGTDLRPEVPIDFKATLHTVDDIIKSGGKKSGYSGDNWKMPSLSANYGQSISATYKSKYSESIPSKKPKRSLHKSKSDGIKWMKDTEERLNGEIGDLKITGANVAKAAKLAMEGQRKAAKEKVVINPDIAFQDGDNRVHISTKKGKSMFTDGMYETTHYISSDGTVSNNSNTASTAVGQDDYND